MGYGRWATDVNRIDRLTAILLLLQEQPHTAAVLARHFEVSRRTIMRDVQALCEIGVPVVMRSATSLNAPTRSRVSSAPCLRSITERRASARL